MNANEQKREKGRLSKESLVCLVQNIKTREAALQTVMRARCTMGRCRMTSSFTSGRRRLSMG